MLIASLIRPFDDKKNARFYIAPVAFQNQNIWRKRSRASTTSPCTRAPSFRSRFHSAVAGRRLCLGTLEGTDQSANLERGGRSSIGPLYSRLRGSADRPARGRPRRGRVPEMALETHEEYAEQFLWATGLTLALAGTALVVRKKLLLRGITALTVLATVGVAGAAIRVGHAGGKLVYVHNAAAAYISSPQTVVASDASKPTAAKDGSASGEADDRE
jgi:hypothetical protein